MLNEIEQRITLEQANDLVSRLESDDTTAALAAEIELGLLWGLSQVTDVDLHPKLASKRRPEAFCPSLFPSGPAYIEITAVSDDSFSDRDKMERAANIICQFANSCRSGSGSHLYFRFAESSGYAAGRYDRKRHITSGFRLTSELQDAIKSWLGNSSPPKTSNLRLTNHEIDAVIEWKKYVHPEGRTFSTMPPIAYHLEDNPVFRRLDKKRSQLSGVPKEALKCIFLGDAGCATLRDLTPVSPDPRAVTGGRIIQHFLKKSSIDIVVVFSAQRSFNYPINSPRIWRVTIFDNRTSRHEGEYDLLNRMVTAHLPRPRYEAYQARSLHRQTAFSPQKRGREFLGTEFRVAGKSMTTTVKFSARLFQEFIAGRIAQDEFRGLNGALELFERQMKQGCTLSAARVERAGIDEDDDYLVFEFSIDPAARPLRNPKAITDVEGENK
jgi:hypothetical protein